MLCGMLCGDSSWESRLHLVEVNVRMYADWYIPNIIQEHVLPYAGFIDYNNLLAAIMPHDNAQVHVAEAVMPLYMSTPKR